MSEKFFKNFAEDIFLKKDRLLIQLMTWIATQQLAPK